MKKMLLEMLSELREENKKLKLENENLTKEVAYKSETLLYWYNLHNELEKQLKAKDNE